MVDFLFFLVDFVICQLGWCWAYFIVHIDFASLFIFRGLVDNNVACSVVEYLQKRPTYSGKSLQMPDSNEAMRFIKRPRPPYVGYPDNSTVKSMVKVCSFLPPCLPPSRRHISHKICWVFNSFSTSRLAVTFRENDRSVRGCTLNTGVAGHAPLHTVRSPLEALYFYYREV